MPSPDDGTFRCASCSTGLNAKDRICWRCGSASIERVGGFEGVIPGGCSFKVGGDLPCSQEAGHAGAHHVKVPVKVPAQTCPARALGTMAATCSLNAGHTTPHSWAIVPRTIPGIAYHTFAAALAEELKRTGISIPLFSCLYIRGVKNIQHYVGQIVTLEIELNP